MTTFVWFAYVLMTYDQLVNAADMSNGHTETARKRGRSGYFPTT